MQPNPPNPMPSVSCAANSDSVDDGAYFGAAVPARQLNSNDSDLLGPTPLTPVTELPPVVAPPPQQDGTAPLPPTTGTAARHVQFRPLNRDQSAIRLRRLRPVPSSLGVSLAPQSSHEPLARAQTQTEAHDFAQEQGQNDAVMGRRRSSSAPQRPLAPREAGAVPASSGMGGGLPVVSESGHIIVSDDVESQLPPAARRRFHRLGRRGNAMGGGQQQLKQQQQGQSDEDCYDSRVVDFLDVIDPEVATLSSITNIQNSLFLPSLGKWVNRRPTYDLTHLPPMPGAFPPSKESIVSAAEHVVEGSGPGRPPSLSSVLTSEPQYAVLPNDASLEGWKEEDIKLLNDYVRHMLHSRRSKIKQQFKAFGKYARRPVGFLVTLYATLITLFGLAWVLFLIGWIYVGEKQLYIINVIDYTLVALFAIVGDGMIPWRAVDTYHMFFVARYHRKTWRMRKKLLLPDLPDHNDLPTGHHDPTGTLSDVEAQRIAEKIKQDELKNTRDEFIPVLSEKEHARLIHHQTKLAKSHTFYKPHETETHHAFPLRLLIAVVLLLDLHSCLQVSLGAVTFGIPYETRPAAATTTILCCSIFTNILAGVLITVGDRRTRKKDVLERLMRQEMTGEVMKKIVKKKEKEKEEAEGGKTSLMEGLTLPWVDKDKERTSADGRTSRSVSLPRGGSKPKDADKVGRFSSDIPSTRKSMGDGEQVASGAIKEEGEKTKPVNAKEEYRVPGAFTEER